MRRSLNLNLNLSLFFLDFFAKAQYLCNIVNEKLRAKMADRRNCLYMWHKRDTVHVKLDDDDDDESMMMTTTNCMYKVEEDGKEHQRNPNRQVRFSRN